MFPISRPTLLDAAKALLSTVVMAISVAPFMGMAFATFVYFLFLTFVLDLLKV